MTSIRHIGSAFIMMAALSLTTLASAEQAPTPACDGEKVEQKQPTAERSKQSGDKSDEKSAPKSERKADDKSDPSQSGKS